MKLPSWISPNRVDGAPATFVGKSAVTKTPAATTKCDDTNQPKTKPGRPRAIPIANIRHPALALTKAVAMTLPPA